VDAAPLCFCDAAYDALGTETIAANAMAASTLIFEVMRIPPTRIVIIANGNVYAVAGLRTRFRESWDQCSPIRGCSDSYLSEKSAEETEVISR
jgi:hypothetical protein